MNQPSQNPPKSRRKRERRQSERRGQKKSRSQRPRRSIGWRERLLCYLAYGLFRVLTFGYKVKFVGVEHRDQAFAMHPKGSFVFGLWHEFFFTAVATHQNMGIAPMISQSSDGEIIAFIAQKLGFRPVRGSTTRGGEKAREALYRRVNRGLMAAFTADGPRGPRRRLKSGLVDLSRTGQMAILPMAIKADRRWTLTKTWDQTFIPKPFAKIVVAYGPPVMIAPDTHGKDFATAKQQVTTSLNAMDSVAEESLTRWQALTDNR